ncbi:acetate--CoA ligase family protein [Marinobacterium sp. D7]|uniref:acetate--CoA ligase family protein n=1 Tax=Marinobacterium ramblicola TaxID=2849041 RepID=UPI001C2D03F1|nr:acetate--CoA ligase family protein [Marinobacterium ramblicola]MBV1788660.1 acetate--CoA ligase family protein [Marinobacterium ramblicola]
MKQLDALLNPKSIAVIGASADPNKTSGRPISYLLKHGFSGAIYPVNPKATEIQGLTCYNSVDALPAAPDVGLVLLNAKRSIDAVRSLSAMGCKAAVVLASGFAEAGEGGQNLQDELKEAAGSMRILGPNTIGLVNLSARIPLSASGALEVSDLPAGHVAVVSQSGGILGALLSRAAGRGIGLSSLISTSNEVDLEVSDFIDYLVDDENTKVIALYLESIRNPQRFREVALRAREAGKPLVVFKIGRSEAGASAASSHTGALAGEDRVYDAFFRELGVIRANTFDEFLDIPAVLVAGRKLPGRRVAILTSTGGAGTLIADSLGMNDFDTPAPDAVTAEKLRALQGDTPTALDRNPIDVTLAGLQPDLLRQAIRTLLESESYDALVVIIGSSGLAMPDLVVGAIQDSLDTNDKPVLAYVSPYAPDTLKRLNRAAIPGFSSPESCSAVLEALHFTGQPLLAGNTVAAGQLPDLSALSGSVDEAAAKALFSEAGISVPDSRVVKSRAEAEQAASELGAPVVLKVLDANLLHKSDIGGVALHLNDQTIGERFDRMVDDVASHTDRRPDTFLVEKMVGGGHELILGANRDALGTAILLGAGGVTAELFKDTTLCMLPAEGGLSLEQAHTMMRKLTTWPLLDGYRGSVHRDTDALAQAIVNFSALVAQAGERLVTSEINPLFVLPEGQGVVAADAVLVLEHQEHEGEIRHG